MSGSDAVCGSAQFADINEPMVTGLKFSRKAERIVIVDDNQDMCGFLAAALKADGYEVETASDGAQALDLLGNREANLLITDLFMPGQDGFRTITRCRPEFPHTRIIVILAGTIPGMPHDFLATASLQRG